jgi:hypothetical protein
MHPKATDIKVDGLRKSADCRACALTLSLQDLVKEPGTVLNKSHLQSQMHPAERTFEHLKICAKPEPVKPASIPPSAAAGPPPSPAPQC